MTGTWLPFRGVTLTALALVTFLAACDTAEERAEGHYESALELLEAGDVARAKVELRTVFSLVPDHRAARETFARVLLEEGEVAAAFGQYMRLVEETPDALEPRLVVAELLVYDNAFEQAEEHLDAIQRLAPDEPRAKVLANVVKYRDAVVDNDVDARRAARDAALELAETLPGNAVNNSVIADAMMLDEDFEALFEQLDRIQVVQPDERRFYQFRLTGYGRMGDVEGVERTLRTMVETFPEDEGLPETLMRFYSSRGDIDGAEEYLRSRIVRGQSDDGARLSLVRFLTAASGTDVALEEVRSLIEEGTNDELFQSVEASLIYDSGSQEEALDLFEGIVSRAQPSAQANNIKASYAEILLREGNEVGARALVEEVLAEDPSHVPSLLMRAGWLISDDQADEAILALRTAQDQDPENPVIFTELAEAYLRNGERTLAGEMLSLAAETSNRAPDESIVYARFLNADGRHSAAETVLIDALRLAPGNVGILVELGATYVRMEDWARVQDVEDELREQTDPAVIGEANRLRLASLRAQGRNAEAVAFLETFSNSEEGNLGADLAIARTLVAEGDLDGARLHLLEMLERFPDEPNARFTLGGVYGMQGDFERAIEIFGGLIEDGVAGESIWVQFVRALTQAGRSEEAMEALANGLEAVPEAMDLKWMQASVFEQAGDFDSAIGVYEELYAINDDSPIVANNLASLLSTVRSDEESLDRADRIARRLRGTEVPSFQDTYGWIRHLQGDYAEAIEYLQPAAEALSTDAMVQAHLGLTLAALDRPAEAITQMELALEMAADDPHPTFETARQRLIELQNSDTDAGSDANAADALPTDDGNAVGD